MSKKIKLSDLTPDARNHNEHTPAGMALLERSVEKVGIIESITVSSDDAIISGNARHEVIGRKFDGREAIVVETDGSQPVILKRTDIKSGTKQFHEAAILANTTAQKNISLNPEIINELAQDYGMDIAELGVEALDWQPQELDAEDDDFEMPDEETIITEIKEGDLIQIGRHRLLCGDSTKDECYQKLMDGRLLDLMVTDPPYNVAYEGKTKDRLTIQNDSMTDSQFYNFLFDFYTCAHRYTKEGGGWYVWYADSEGHNFRRAMADSGIKVRQCLIWVKNAMVLGRQDYQWKHEPCLYGWKAGAPHYFVPERNHTTVFEDMVDLDKMKKDEMKALLEAILSDSIPTTVIRENKPHRSTLPPTIKPVKLIGRLIANSSMRNQLVGDFFLGSGTTMVAAEQMERTCYGMELDPKYCEVIIQRMLTLNPNIEIKKNGQPWQPSQS